jgi:hypothetical protein
LFRLFYLEIKQTKPIINYERRWKYQQIQVDLGLLVSFITAAFDLYSMTFQEVYLSEKHNPYRIIRSNRNILVSYLVGRRN